MTDLLLIATTLLAEDGAPRQTGPDFGKASPVGLLILVLLLIGTFALVFSMNRHLKRLPESFDPDHPEADQAVDEGTAGDAKG
ncbi:hypothetical protein [Mycobacterium sp. C31M]